MSKFLTAIENIIFIVRPSDFANFANNLASVGKTRIFVSLFIALQYHVKLPRASGYPHLMLTDCLHIFIDCLYSLIGRSRNIKLTFTSLHIHRLRLVLLVKVLLRFGGVEGKKTI